MPFIYVFSGESRDKLLSAGFRLLKEDNKQEIFVFENSSELKFAMPDVSYILSDKLTF